MNLATIVKDELSLMDKSKLLEQVKKRYQAACVDADKWSSLLEACYHYAVPFRNRFYQPKGYEGDSKNTRLFDTTAVEAVTSFVSKMQETMTPVGVQWGFLELDEDWLGDDVDESDREDAQKALDKYMRILFNYIGESNFDVSVNESYYDLAVGTAALVCNQGDDKDPLLFTSIPIDKLKIVEAFDGRIKSWYRSWDEVKISEIQTRFSKAKITDEMFQMMTDNIDSTVRVLCEGVTYFPKATKPYYYTVWADDRMLYDEWLESNPAVIWRFQKTNNETWGRGVVMSALPSIITLNEIARIEIAAANLNTFKPMMAFSDGVFNPHTFRMQPFAIIPVAPVGSQGQFPLQPLPDTSNPQFSQIMIQDLRNQIRVLMYASAEETPSIQPQTAAEVGVKQQELASRIGPLFSRLQSEFLWPIIERVAHILDKMGKLPKPRFEDKVIKFKYKSPLALAKGQQDVSRVIQFAQLMQGLVGEQQVTMFINMKQAPWLIAESMQIDPRYLNTPEQVEQAMQAVTEQMQEGNMTADGQLNQEQMQTQGA